MAASSSNAWSRPLISPNQDTSSVYYIHASDANTSQLVYVKLNGTIYSIGKRSIMLSSTAKINSDL